jgi:RNA polymerase sigma factor (sigma-70 family)
MVNESEREGARRRIETSYRTNRTGFLRRARRVSGAVADAEDVVQDAFLAALNNLDSFAQVADPSSWIYTAIRNRLIDLWRRDRTRRSAGQVDVGEETLREIVAATGLDPEDTFVQDELSDALAEAIEALPERQRSIIVAQVFHARTFREISERSGIPIETLSARKRAAVRALARTLRGWIEEP